MLGEIVQLGPLTYRLLPVEEWGRAYPVLIELFGGDIAYNIPDPLVGSLAVTETPDGEIVGVCFMQMRLHSEPFGAKTGAGVSPVGFAELFDRVMPPGQTYFAFVADDQRALDSLARAGFDAMPGFVIHSRMVRGKD